MKTCEKSQEGHTPDENRWDDTIICPLCLEAPHNAVRLLCSSKQCRPYICDTSYRHSNCFDQWSRTFGRRPNKMGAADGINSFLPLENIGYQGLHCPLCRGRITGWIVEREERNRLNLVPRSCALESCDFSGDYYEIRKHARRQHPNARPTEGVQLRSSEQLLLPNGFDDGGGIMVNVRRMDVLPNADDLWEDRGGILANVSGLRRMNGLMRRRIEFHPFRGTEGDTFRRFRRRRIEFHPSISGN